MINKIHHYMEEVQFCRGQVIYNEGSSNVDTVYFIKTGEFSVTKNPGNVVTNDPEEEKKEPSTHRKLKQSPIRSQKVKEMMISRSDRLLGTDKGGLSKNAAAKKFLEHNKDKTIRLYLLGKNEIFGMEEIVAMQNTR